MSSTTCVIVGGGPAGAILSLLLARQGLAVRLLEAHHDFDRDFRGDTVHPATMEVLDELGLADGLLQLRHAKMSEISAQTSRGRLKIDFRGLKTRFPFVTMLPQARFIEFIVNEASRYPNFQIMLGARVDALIEENNTIRGVRYLAAGSSTELHALLTVGADGRFSTVRKLAGLTPKVVAPPLDVIWFRVPRDPTDTDQTFGRSSAGLMAGAINRFDYWQMAVAIPSDSYQQWRAMGVEMLRRKIAEVIPELASNLEHFTDWKQTSFLSAQATRLVRWYRPGLLLIGDAAHTMSPVGGLGINYAIQDAVAAANLLSQPLKRGVVPEADLAAVQRRREFPTKIAQAYQRLVQRQVFEQSIQTTSNTERFPLMVQLFQHSSLLQALIARFVAFGIRPEHITK